jgi:O-antigen ligase
MHQIMQIELIGRNNWQKALFLVLISGLVFAALHKWSTVVRLGLQLVLLGYIIWLKRGQVFCSLTRMPLLPATSYVAFVLITITFSVNRFESLQSWLRLFEIYVLAVSVYHLIDNRSQLRTVLFYVLVGFGFIFIMDIQEYVRRLGDRWQWGVIWETPVNFKHHNTYSAICVALVPIAVTFLLTCRQMWIRSVLGLVILMDLFLVYVLQSRSAQLSLVLTLLLSGFFMATFKRKIIYTIAIVVLVAGAVLNIDRVNRRWRDPSSLTGLGRTTNWRNAAALIAERPVFGWGYGRKIYREVYEERFGKLDYKGHKLDVPHAHSGYLDRLFANGILGFLIFLTIPVTALVGLLQVTVRRRADWLTARALLLSLLAVFFYLVADIHDGAQWGLMWFLLVVALRIPALEEERDSVSSSA